MCFFYVLQVLESRWAEYGATLGRLDNHYRVCLRANSSGRKDAAATTLPHGQVCPTAVQGPPAYGVKKAQSASTAREDLDRVYRTSEHRRATDGILKGISVPVGGTQWQYVCIGCRDTPFHMQCFAPAHGTTTADTEDGEESEPPLSQETDEGDAVEDDPEADGRDKEGTESDEENKEEDAEDARGSVENDTLENFSFSVQWTGWWRWPSWDQEHHGRQASAIPTHGDQCKTWGGRTAQTGYQTARPRPLQHRCVAFYAISTLCLSGLVLPPVLLEAFSAFSMFSAFRSVPERYPRSMCSPSLEELTY